VTVWRWRAAQGSYMSVFLTLICSEMDELLDWPFSKRVSVTLLDQSEDAESRRHVTHVIDRGYELADCVSRVSLASSASQSPPFGIQQFIRLEQLNAPDRYVRDDAVLFGFSIDDD